MLPSLRSRGAHYIASALILVAALVAASAAVAEGAEASAVLEGECPAAAALAGVGRRRP